MAYILCLETATQICSVALCDDNTVIQYKETELPNAHSKVLAGFIQEILRESGIQKTQLNAIAVSKGPGSYTGLRIGVSTAKGLCYGLDIPLISIPTLYAMAVGASHQTSEKGLFCPMIDARRMEVYAAVYDQALIPVQDVSAVIVEPDTFSELLKDNKMLFFGDGASKCKDLLQHPNAVFADHIKPSARNMAGRAFEKFTANEMEDVAYFEPFYLKDFIAGKPRVKGLFDV